MSNVSHIIGHGKIKLWLLLRDIPVTDDRNCKCNK